jgi:hypothetical protein
MLKFLHPIPACISLPQNALLQIEWGVAAGIVVVSFALQLMHVDSTSIS